MDGPSISRRKVLEYGGALLIAGCSRAPEQRNPVVSSEMSNAVTSASESWSRIHKWLQRHAPKILANLNPAASDAEIKAAQVALRSTLPDEWRHLYSVHNGMNDIGDFGSLFFGMQFLTIDKVISEHKECTNAEVVVSLKRTSPGIRVQNIFNPKWIALAHDGGDTLLQIDFDPDQDGSIGQVIFIDHAHQVGILLAPNISTFLSAFADDLENGQYSLNPDAPKMETNSSLVPRKSTSRIGGILHVGSI